MALSEEPGAPDLRAAIEADHAELERHFASFESGMTATTYDEILAGVVALLTSHAAAEDQVLYPAVREVIGADDAERSQAEHDRMRALLERIEATAELADTRQDFIDLMAEVRHHVPPEEQELLPQLQRALGDARMLELGVAFRAASTTRDEPEDR